MDINQFAQQAVYKTLPNKRFSKVFGIGYNKTGSTSLELVFKALALNVPNQHEQELITVKQLYEGNFEPFQKFVSNYDAFQDMPFSQDDWYIVADTLFPNSKFILTLRDAEKWFDSISRFHAKTFGVENASDFDEDYIREKAHYLYPGYFYEMVKRHVSRVEDGKVIHDWSLLYDKEHYIKFYTERNDRIIRYFENRPDDLLVIDMTQEKDVSKIVSFLGFPEELNFNMPHLNKTG